jgi:hypothetical protein
MSLPSRRSPYRQEHPGAAPTPAGARVGYATVATPRRRSQGETMTHPKKEKP